MVQKLRILLVEDDPVVYQEIEKLIDMSDDFDLVGITNNSEKALDYVKDFMPDAVILDLELHQGGGSGISFLNRLTMSAKPYILVTTNNSSKIIRERIRQLGADYIMIKHQEGYSNQEVLEHLRIMCPAIQSDRTHINILPNTSDEPKQYRDRIMQQIKAKLCQIGINPKNKGFDYLQDAIMLQIEHPGSQNICQTIATKNGKAKSSVERAMQNAIARAWRPENLDYITQFYTARFSVVRGCPTITEFVCYYAKELMDEYKGHP